MAPYNIAFHVVLVDPRPLAELLPALDEMFGAKFAEDLEFKAQGRIRYNCYAFGISVSFSKAESLPEGAVFRLDGLNDGCCQFETAEMVDISFHVLHLLRNAGFARLMTSEKFKSEAGSGSASAH